MRVFDKRIAKAVGILAVALLVSPLMFAVAQESDEEAFLPFIVQRAGSQGSDSSPTPTATATAAPDATGTPSGSATPTLVPGVSPTPTPTATSTPTEPPDCERYGEEVSRSTHFGAQMYWDTRPSIRTFDSLVNSSTGWVRTEVTWYRTEPENTSPANYNWVSVDQELALAVHSDIELVATFGHAPGWAAKKSNGKLRDGMLDELVEVLTAVVERYDGDGVDDAPCSPTVNYWEIYNEPDAVAKWGNYPEEYAEMLAAVYPAIKSASPNAQILFGGVAQDGFLDQGGSFVRNWVESVLAAGAGPNFDYMNLHAFPTFWAEWASHPPGTLGKVTAFRSILQDYGLDKPFVITETGVFISSNDVAQEHRQAVGLVQVFTESRVAGVGPVFWFTYHDLAGYPRLTGLVTNAKPPIEKPSFAAYNFMIEMFEDAEYVQTLTSEPEGGDYLAYEFDDPVNNRRLVAAWVHWELNTTRAELTFEVDQATVYSMDGSGSTFVAEDGEVTIDFGREPIIIELPR